MGLISIIYTCFKKLFIRSAEVWFSWLYSLQSSVRKGVPQGLILGPIHHSIY